MAHVTELQEALHVLDQGERRTLSSEAVSDDHRRPYLLRRSTEVLEGLRSNLWRGREESIGSR